MTLDENAAAYGLFQLTFANLVERFAVKDLKKELKEFERQSLHDVVVREIRNACAKAATLAAWRNPRIHARVQISDNGIRIYDQKTRKPLAVNRDECIKKIEQALSIRSNLDYSAGELLKHVHSGAKIRARLREIFKTIEDRN